MGLFRCNYILNPLINYLEADVEEIEKAKEINHRKMTFCLKASVVEKEVEAVERSFSKSKQSAC